MRNTMTFSTRFALFQLVVLLSGCASFGVSKTEPKPETVCVKAQPGVFATAAQRFDGRSKAIDFIGKLFSLNRKEDGDLIITDSSVRFVTCSPNTVGDGVFAIPHADTELVYREGNWLFLRSMPKEDGYREYHAFSLHGTLQTRGETLARVGMAELRNHRAAKGLFVAPPTPVESRLVIVDRGIPEVRIASVDRHKIGKETGKGMAGGALGGIAVGLNPQAPIILYPPAAAVLIVGGALIGGTTGAIAAEREAQRNALMLPLEDLVIGRALNEMAIGPRLATQIESLMRIETRWLVRTESADSLNCGLGYRDCALRGVLGVVEVSAAKIEFRADKNDLLSDQDQARQRLSVLQTVNLYSTLSGQVVESIDLHAYSDRHSLVEWRDKDGARLRESVREALQPMPDVIAMKLQRALDKLITFE